PAHFRGDFLRGGEILHWDVRRLGWHLTHCVARRPEAYHEGLAELDATALHSIHDGVKVKDPAAIEGVFRYDRGLRVAAQDTVLWPSATRDDYANQRLATVGHAASWQAVDQHILMAMEGGFAPYEKRIELGAGVSASYRFQEPARIFSEWNLSLPDGAAGEPPAFTLGPGTVAVEATGLHLCASHNAGDVWVQQLFSASNTEGGVELAPQGWSIVFAADMDAPGTTLTIAWSAGG
ncbi:MAG: alpha-amylase/4-alpha-glucanotransferase domain-containing protein, partial [Tepidiformaceae bacterium]